MSVLMVFTNRRFVNTPPTSERGDPPRIAWWRRFAAIEGGRYTVGGSGTRCSDGVPSAEEKIG